MRIDELLSHASVLRENSRTRKKTTFTIKTGMRELRISKSTDCHPWIKWWILNGFYFTDNFLRAIQIPSLEVAELRYLANVPSLFFFSLIPS